MTDKYYDIYFDRDFLQLDEGGKEQTLYGLYFFTTYKRRIVILFLIFIAICFIIKEK